MSMCFKIMFDLHKVRNVKNLLGISMRCYFIQDDQKHIVWNVGQVYHFEDVS